jgi:Flp pilus assembly protein TadG
MADPARRSTSAGESWLGRFAGDVRGVAAIEFALIVPVLIVCYLGLSEFGQAYMAQKRMTHTTSQVADMIARAPETSRAEIDAVMDIGSLIMQPFPEAPLDLRVTSITRDNNGVARVDWSRGRGMAALSGVQTVPAGLIANGETIIMGEAAYDYDSPLDTFVPAGTRFSGRHYLRPRLTDQIPCADC